MGLSLVKFAIRGLAVALACLPAAAPSYAQMTAEANRPPRCHRHRLDADRVAHADRRAKARG